MNKQIDEMVKVLSTVPPIEIYGGRGYGRKIFMLTHFAEHLHANGYRKASDVVADVLEILSELKENYLADDDVREACAISYAEIKIVALKKKYESEGADDE